MQTHTQYFIFDFTFDVLKIWRDRKDLLILQVQTAKAEPRSGVKRGGNAETFY